MSSGPVCFRCRQPLTEGSAFCTACGCNNESMLDRKAIRINRDLEDRKLPWWLQWFWKMFDPKT